MSMASLLFDRGPTAGRRIFTTSASALRLRLSLRTVTYGTLLVLVDDVLEVGGGVAMVSGDELLVVRTASDELSTGDTDGGTGLRSHPNQGDTSGGVSDHSCVTQAHETLPWGAQFRNLASAAGHAWIGYDLSQDDQVRLAEQRVSELVAGCCDDGDVVVVGAYSDGSVLANGVEGPAAAIVRVAGVDVSATVRLASADVPLSSGRSEWAGLLLVLYIMRHARAAIQLRLDTIQVANAFDDGEWKFGHNWVRRNDRDMAMLTWALDSQRRERGFGQFTAIHPLG